MADTSASTNANTSNTNFKDGFPFTYGKTMLFDELVFRAYRQKVQEYQEISRHKASLTAFANQRKVSIADAETILKVLAYEASIKMEDALKKSEIKRNAFFTTKSINRHFDLKAQIANYGILGKLISLFMTRNY